MNVEQLLLKKDIYFMPKGRDYLVSCLSPTHEDRNPSLRIDQITGVFQCFSCEFKGNVFDHFGEQANELQIKRETFKRLLELKRSESVGIRLPEDRVSFNQDWRNISAETFNSFNAFTHHEANFIGRVVFPIVDATGKTVGAIGRHMGQESPKYKVVPPGAKLPFFPIVKPIQGSIILVEGIFDALNLHDKGLPNAVTALGTKTINKPKLELLKMQGVTSIIIMLDNDEAGQAAAKVTEELCAELGIVTRNIALKANDPGELSAQSVRKLKEKLYD